MEQVKHGAEWYKARAIERRKERRVIVKSKIAAYERDIAELEKQFSYLGLKK